MRTLETVAAAGVSAALAMAYLVIAGRTLGPAAYADFAGALSFVYFFAVALTPLTPALARVVAALEHHNDIEAIAAMRRHVLRRAIIALAAFVAAGAIAAFALGPLLHFRSPAPLFLAFAVTAAFVILSIDRGFLQGLFRFRAYNSSTVVDTGVRLGLAAVLLAGSGRSAALGMAAYLAGLIVAELIAVLSLRDVRGPRNAPADWTALRRLAVPMFALMIAVAVLQNADMIAVKRWFSPEVSGLYGAASALARTFGVVFVPLYVLSGPTLTQRHEAGEPIAPAAIRLTLLYAVLCAVPLAVLAIRPDPVVRALYGDAFSGASWLIAPLGGVAVIMYCGLLLVQVPITLHRFEFLKAYAAGAVAQIAALALFHQTLVAILWALYAVQAVLFVTVGAMVARVIPSGRAVLPTATVPHAAPGSRIPS